MENILILGAGGFAKEVAFLIDEINGSTPTWNILGFITNDGDMVGKPNGKYKIYGVDEVLTGADEPINAAVGIGDPKLIKKLTSKFVKNKNISFPNLVHPNVIGDWARIKIGAGNIICAGNIFTTDIQIGSFNIFNLSCTVGHDSSIGNCNVFNPTSNLSGGITVEDGVLVGTGAQVLQGLTICGDCVIGAGAVVTKSPEEPGIYTGIPARKLK